MLRFEIKKIFSKTINKIVFAGLLAVTLLAALLAIRDVKYINENGETVSAFTAARKLQELKNRYKGPLSEEVLQEVIEQNKNMKENSANRDDALQKSQSFSDIRDMITLAFGEFGGYDYDIADNISTEEVKNFYQRRITGLEEYLNSEKMKGAFTDEEKTYLINQYKQTETPLHYEYADGWKALLDSQYLPTLMMLVVVLIGFMVAGIFSDEFQYKADAIFFSAKLGRNKAIVSKIGAGFIVTTGMYWVSMFIYSAIILITLGFGGADCQIQTGFSNWSSIYNLTYWQDYIFTMVGGYIGMLFILTLAMFISAKCRSTVLAITVPFVLSCVPMFLGRVAIFSKVAAFTPDQLLRINTSLEDFTLVRIGENIFGYLTVILPIYFVLSFVIFLAIYWIYKKAEVK